MLGYFQDPKATAEAQKFGWHHTGDLGRWDEQGRLEFIDRKKDMIKTGGENVASVKVGGGARSPGCSGFRAVFGLPHPHWSEAVCAFVVRKPGATVDVESRLAHKPQSAREAFEVPSCTSWIRFRQRRRERCKM